MTDAVCPPVPARRFGLTMAAIFRDEAPYLAEWIEYHTLLGVEHVYLYDNGSKDRPLEVLRPYILQGRATLLSWPEFPGQEAAYNHALKVFGRDCDWMLLIDVDEYLCLPPGRMILDFLASLGPEVDQVLMPWIHFGASGHEVRPSGLVIESYVHRVSDAHRQPKTILRPEAVLWAGVHHCVTRARRTIDPSGRILPETWLLDEPPRGDMSVAHFFTKSREEFAAKLARGQADGGGGKTMADFHRFDTPVEDRSVATLAPLVREALGETARRVPGNVFSAWSAASDLTPSRAWLLAVKSALARTATALDVPAARVRVAADRGTIMSTMVPHAVAMEALAAVSRAIDATSLATLPVGTTRIVPADARIGRPFVAWSGGGGNGTITISVRGRDAAGKPWFGSADIEVQEAGTLAFATLSERTMFVHEIEVDAPAELICTAGAVFGFV